MDVERKYRVVSCVTWVHRRRYTLTVEGIGSQRVTSSRGQTTLVMRSYHDAEFECRLDAHILPSITSTIPASPIDTSGYKHLHNIPLADPTFHTPGSIDVRIGADIMGMLLLGETITGGPKQPCALHTRLGWVICGPTSPRCASLPALGTPTECVTEEERLDEILQRFWELEEVPRPKTTDDICEEIFHRTVSRKSNGRYIVQIPFSPDAPALGDSYGKALGHFFNLERRLRGDDDLRQKYVQFMREYETLGHMEKITLQRDDPSHAYFIRHHAVTAKFRVVFNASAKSSNGVSLNDTQLVGPAVQDPLVDILLRFRRFRVAVTADIEKMFRQIEVDSRHRCWQQILWCESPNDPLRAYQLKTLTYGMACSPYNAARVLNQCAIDNQIVVPDANRAAAARDSILRNFYMEDLLDSADTPIEAITLARVVSTIL
ncbi:uncharacterized protein LOC118734938 [Rhagoletis pomonella]|uniref:uncharacterized protein LOC118734938 n=1 Tax=Rhagoletis pomonella TaxID=28610 RepID=UPI001783F72C|nr:uncharacterized protein LOC118734938 [Rhagoletis pomonella]